MTRKFLKAANNTLLIREHVETIDNKEDLRESINFCADCILICLWGCSISS